MTLAIVCINCSDEMNVGTAIVMLDNSSVTAATSDVALANRARHNSRIGCTWGIIRVPRRVLNKSRESQQTRPR